MGAFQTDRFGALRSSCTGRLGADRAIRGAPSQDGADVGGEVGKRPIARDGTLRPSTVLGAL